MSQILLFQLIGTIMYLIAINAYGFKEIKTVKTAEDKKVSKKILIVYNSIALATITICAIRDNTNN